MYVYIYIYLSREIGRVRDRSVASVSRSYIISILLDNIIYDITYILLDYVCIYIYIYT